MMAGLRCAACQQPMQPEEAREVLVEQGTASSQLYVHKRYPCKRGRRS